MNTDYHGILTRSKAKKLSINKDDFHSLDYNSESDLDYEVESNDEMSCSDTESIDSNGNLKDLIDDEDVENAYPGEFRINISKSDENIFTNLITKYLTEGMEEEEDLDTGCKKLDDIQNYMKKHIKSKDELSYFKSLDKEEQKKIIEIEKNIKSNDQTLIPLRYSIIKSDINLKTKSLALRKVEILNSLDPSSGEFHKTKQWVHGLLNIPFNKYIELPVKRNDPEDKIQNYLTSAQEKLNNSVYGHKQAKTHILQIISQWIVNPESIGNVLAIHGAMGIGKTTLVKEGICLNRPYAFISLGGATDSSYLDGHSYTYEGSIPGRIVQILTESKCMNPIIYFDELDKISSTAKGEEITNLLIHMTDASQNSHFQDKYFSGIDIDLSRCLFIFSYNNLEEINPILLDRMYNIKLDSFGVDEKTTIFKQYLIPELYSKFKFDISELIFEDDDIKFIINNYCDDSGIRSLKRCLDTILSKINILKLTNQKLNLEYKIDNLKFPLKISKDIIESLLKKKNNTGIIDTMYT